MAMTEREKLLRVLRREDADSACVICPGGMMSLAVSEVMAEAHAEWPSAHVDRASMARLALAMHDATGFANHAVPFCMTVEAESYGAEVHLGGRASHPRVRGHVLSANASGSLPEPDFSKGRAAVLLDAIGTLKSARPDVAVIGNLVGPFSLLGMLADPLQLLRWTRRQPQRVCAYLERITADLASFGRLQIEAGADVICVAEPTATGEILGPDLFGLLVATHLRSLSGSLRSMGAPVILHICGDASATQGELFGLPVDALSFDSIADIVELQAMNPPWLAMGNLSPFILEQGPVKTIKSACRRLLEGGIRLVSPACGVIVGTPVSHLRAVSDAVARER